MTIRSIGHSLLVVGLAVAVTGCLGSVQTGGGGGTGGSGGGSMNTGGGGGTGGGGTGGSGGGGGSTTPPPIGNRLCTSVLSFAGNYVQGNPPPSDLEGGCWPDGTWTFTANVDSTDCAAGMAPTVQPQYVFQVTQDDDFNMTIVYQTDPTNMNISLKISGGDGAVCTGAFLIFSSDGKTIWNLRPALQPDNTLNGHGDIQVWDADQR
jgi:hypothetical protein